MNRINRILGVALTASVVMILELSGSAHAIVPAKSPLGITVTVTHGEEKDVIENVESATFMIQLVPAAPYLSSPSDQVKLAGEESAYNYKITALANGPDTYALNSAVTAFDNLESAPELSFKQDDVSIESLTLGVTAASEPSPVPVSYTHLTLPTKA